MIESVSPQPAVAERSLRATDTARNRVFPVEVWYPEAAGGTDALPLILFSHHSGGSRRASTFLTTHLARHGYAVAAMDHSEVVATELLPKQNETTEQRAKRGEAWIASRVPDLRFLLDYMLSQPLPEMRVDADRIGAAGHSFGGWTVLEAPGVEPRIRSVVALAPGGSRKRRSGIIPVTAEFRWTREVPLLVVAADQDACLPMDGMYELFERAPEPKTLVALERADHMHFVDDVEQTHEAFRTMPLEGDLAEIQADMRPIAELCTGEEAHRCIQDVTLAHFNASLKRQHD
jgi:predicted dienelactone hydrolase